MTHHSILVKASLRTDHSLRFGLNAPFREGSVNPRHALMPSGRLVNSWYLNRAGEIKGNAPPTNYYRGLCVLGDDVLSCVETSRWQWSPVDSFIGGLRFVCRSR